MPKICFGGKKDFKKTIHRDEIKRELISKCDKVKTYIEFPYYEDKTIENVKRILIEKGVI